MTNWNAIAGEVAGALAAVSDYKAVLRRRGDFADDFAEQRSADSFFPLTLLQSSRLIRDNETGSVRALEKQLMIAANGPVPRTGDQIALGISEGDITPQTNWDSIAEVIPVSPAGIALYYKVILEG